MPTSAPGNKPRRSRLSGGFTLIELMVVVALIAIASAAISLALPDADAAQLEREAERLAALLEAGRAEARVSALSVSWAPVRNDSGDNFRFQGLPPRIALPTRWLGQGVDVEIIGGRALLLGPEPFIGQQRLRLRQGQHEVLLSTDGMAPFALVREEQAK